MRVHPPNINSKRKYIIIYTICFIFMAFAASLPWIITGKSFVWKIDGQGQHYPALVYLGRTLREFFIGIFSGHAKWNMWDLNIGFGSDVLGTLNYYCIGDPLDLLSVFVPKAYTEYLYEFLIIFRMYLAGLAFSAFAFYKKSKYCPALIGSFVYVFSGYVLMYGIKHPFFTNPLIYLPLLLIGIDKIILKKKSILFTLMVTLSLISNFYFFYMLTIAVFLYALYRVADVYRENRIKEYVRGFFKGTAYYLLGVINAMIIFLPVLCAFMESGRSSGNSFREILFAGRYYKGLFTHLVAIGTTEAQTNIGYFSIAVILFCLLLCRKNKNYRVYRIFTILSLIGLIFPAVGFGMTGFSYVANRWIFMFTFVLAMGTVRMLEDRQEVNIKDFWLPAVVVIAAAVTTIFLTDEALLNDIVGIVILAIAFVVVEVAVRQKWVGKQGFYIAIVLLFVVECGVKMTTQFVFSDGGIMNQFITAGKVDDVMTNAGISSIKEEDKSLYRVESIYEGSSNYSLVNDVPTVSSYYSITSGDISETMESLENSDIFTAVWTKDLSRRTGLMELAGVKYYLKRGSGIDLTSIPYNYKLKDTLETKSEDENNDTVYIYENSSAIPLVYGYDNYIKKAQWNKLESYDKESAMLQAAVIEESVEGELTETSPLSNSVVVVNKDEFLSQLKKMNNPNLEVKGDKIIVKSGMVKVPISFKGVRNSETYLNMKGIEYDHLSSKYIKERLKSPGLSKDEISSIKSSGTIDNFYLGGIIGDKYVGFNYCTKYYIYNSSKSALSNYGYSKEPINEAYFYMSAPGEYSFDDIKIVCQPMDNYKKYVKKLKLNIKNLKIQRDKISYNVKLNSEKLICTAVPYSKGWSAKIDGKQAKIIKTNGMYMGVIASEGKHKVEFSYVTPGIRTGSVISLVGWIITLSLFMTFRKKNYR